MSIASHVILVRVLATHASSAMAINISGRQRMLSQRIASFTLQYRMGDETVRPDLLAAVDEFDANLQTLTTGAGASATLASDPVLRNLYYGGQTNLAAMVPAYSNLARQIAAVPPGDQKAAPNVTALLAFARAPLLNQLNAATTEYLRRTNIQTYQLLQLQDFSLVVVLLTLFLEAILIFQPMVRDIMGHARNWDRLLLDRDSFVAEQAQDLKRSNEELEQFAYTISHDLRAPLNNIRILTEWISEDIQDRASPETIKNVARVKARTERLEMMLEGLLEYSRIGRMNAPPELIDTAALVNEIVESLSIPPDFVIEINTLPIVYARRPPLLHVLQNLIGNALKHHDQDHGRVIISCRDLGHHLEFTVADDGPGILPANQEKIFDLFQTVKPTGPNNASGIGLAIVKKAVQTNGGTIHVTSNPPNRGTAFAFTWEKTKTPVPALLY